MEDHNEATGQTAPLSMTQEQLDAIVQERLARQKESFERTLQAQALAYQEDVAKTKGEPTNVARSLEVERAKRSADDIEKQDLSIYFGKNSSGAKAMDLKRTDPRKYAAYRQRAVELGLLDVIKPTGQIPYGRSAFGNPTSK